MILYLVLTLPWMLLSTLLSPTTSSKRKRDFADCKGDDGSLSQSGLLLWVLAHYSSHHMDLLSALVTRIPGGGYFEAGCADRGVFGCRFRCCGGD